jgi:hypothetical protein
MRSWSTFGAWMNHGQTWIHNIHHGLDLGEAITFPLIVFFVLGHRAYIEILEVGIHATLKAHNILCIPSIEVRFEEKL